VRVRVHYQRALDLVRDHDQQISRGGLLIRLAPPPDLVRGAGLELELCLPDGTALTTPATVTHLVGSTGFTVGIRAGAITGLSEVIAAARRRRPPEPAGEPPRHEWCQDEAGIEGELELPAESELAAEAPDDSEDERIPTDAPSRVKAAGVAKRIALALHGSKDERAAILRDINKLFHPYVLRNPNLQLDEVLAIAKMTTVAPELLKTIAERREWAGRPEIALALVRNPKCAAPIAIKLLGFVAPADLRQLAKDTKTRPAIQAAARKKLI
jgi:hypothetical protein